MRARILVFAAVVAIALALNLARLSLSIGQTGEDTLRARLAMASTALKGQLDLLDARLSPRAVATVPDLIEATRAEPGQSPPRPDEKALRAAASALAPEPDLLAVATPQGAILSRRGRPAAVLDNIAQLPLGRAALEGNPAPAFATFDGATWRVAAARVPGNPAAAIIGSLIDDRYAAQLKSQVDADVTLLQGGRIIASSLSGDERTRAAKWAAAPGPGYGVLRVALPLVGDELSGKLPRGTARFAVRGALFPAEGGVQVALTVPASPYHAWLARYQAFYLAGLALFVLFSLVWALLARDKARPPASTSSSSPRRAPGARTEVIEPRSGGEERSSALAESESEVTEPRSANDEPPSGATEPGSEVGEAAADASEMPSGGIGADMPWPNPEPAANTEAFAPAADEPPSAPAWGAEPPAAADSALDPAWGATPSAGATPPSGIEPLHADSPAATQEAPWGSEPLSSEPFADAQRNGAPPDFSEGPTGGISPTDSPEPSPFAGDEPTRRQPVDAGLLEKTRDDESGEDPDEPHWRETFDRFKELKMRLGEPADRISFEKFAAKLKKNRADLLARHNCKGVRFSVYEKEGKAAIKASAIR